MAQPTRSLLIPLALYLIAAAACGGGKDATPTAPSSPAGGAGATIAGTVRGAGATAPTGMSVNVVGTSLSATVAGSGDFQVDGVPSGNVQLQFKSASVTATAQIPDVANEQFVQIQVRHDSIVHFKQQFGTIPFLLHLTLGQPCLLKALRIVDGDRNLRPDLSEQFRIVLSECRFAQAR